MAGGCGGIYSVVQGFEAYRKSWSPAHLGACISGGGVRYDGIVWDRRGFASVIGAGPKTSRKLGIRNA